MARLSDGRDREVKFVRLIRGCAAQEILAMLEEWGVGDIREAACRGMQPKLGLTISDEAWEQIRGMAPKMYGGGGIDMGMLLKILVTRPDVAGKLLEGEYRYR
jgi:hypothetical protein